MNENQNERLFLAMGEVGADLVDLAEYRTFRPNVWRRWGALAACMVLLLGLAAVALPRLGIGITEQANGPSEEQVLKAEPKTRVQFRYTYYYLDDAVFGEQPEDMGELLGVVEASEDETLIDAQVYERIGATAYSNHSVHGLTVYEQVYVKAPGGYVLATTYNEKTVARYTYEDVEEAAKNGDTQWLLTSLVEPVILLAEDVTFVSSDQLTSEQLNRLFLASARLNTGVIVADQWLTEDGAYVVPVSDITWRLERFLNGFVYMPEETDSYDENREAVVFLEAVVYPDKTLYLELSDFILHAEEKQATLTVNQYRDESMTQVICSRVFVISFRSESWYYESIMKTS